jgi:hypothetical protein
LVCKSEFAKKVLGLAYRRTAPDLIETTEFAYSIKEFSALFSTS